MENLRDTTCPKFRFHSFSIEGIALKQRSYYFYSAWLSNRMKRFKQEPIGTSIQVKASKPAKSSPLSKHTLWKRRMWNADTSSPVGACIHIAIRYDILKKYLRWRSIGVLWPYQCMTWKSSSYGLYRKNHKNCTELHSTSSKICPSRITPLDSKPAEVVFLANIQFFRYISFISL